MRILHESGYWEKESFVTLTYDDANLPITPVSLWGPQLAPWPTLQKHELQKFFKRLRRNINAPIKYFACGEYGENTQRPHYHIIFFGLGLSHDNRTAVMAAWPFCDWKNTQIRSKSFGLAEADSIRYVAQYVDKKLSGDDYAKEYYQKGREPVFRVSSQGIGKRYAIDNAQQIADTGYLTYKSIPSSLPRYYLNKLEEIGLKPDTSGNQEKQIQVNEKLLGLSYTDQELQRIPRLDIKYKKMEGLKKAKHQHDQNLKAKIAQKLGKL